MKPPLTKFSTEVFYPTGFLFYIYGFNSIVEFKKYAKSLGNFVVVNRTITHKGSQLPVYAIIPKGKSQRHCKNFSDFAVVYVNSCFFLKFHPFCTIFPFKTRIRPLSYVPVFTGH